MLTLMTDLNQGPPIQTQDITPANRHLFTPEALALLDAPRALLQLEPRPDGQVDACEYLSVLVPHGEDPDPAALKLAGIVNHHVALGHITKFLAGLGHLELSITKPFKMDTCLFIFPMFTPEGRTAFKQANWDGLMDNSHSGNV